MRAMVTIYRGEALRQVGGWWASGGCGCIGFGVGDLVWCAEPNSRRGQLQGVRDSDCEAAAWWPASAGERLTMEPLRRGGEVVERGQSHLSMKASWGWQWNSTDAMMVDARPMVSRLGDACAVLAVELRCQRRRLRLLAVEWHGGGCRGGLELGGAGDGGARGWGHDGETGAVAVAVCDPSPRVGVCDGVCLGADGGGMGRNRRGGESRRRGFDLLRAGTRTGGGAGNDAAHAVAEIGDRMRWTCAFLLLHCLPSYASLGRGICTIHIGRALFSLLSWYVYFALCIRKGDSPSLFCLVRALCDSTDSG
jgi:hypothetical protein